MSKMNLYASSWCPDNRTTLNRSSKKGSMLLINMQCKEGLSFDIIHFCCKVLVLPASLSQFASQSPFSQSVRYRLQNNQYLYWWYLYYRSVHRLLLTTFFVYLRTYRNRIGPNWFFFLVGTCTRYSVWIARDTSATTLPLRVYFALSFLFLPFSGTYPKISVTQ